VGILWGRMLLQELRIAREGKGLTRAALAAQVGASEQAIKRLETGTGSVSLWLDAMKATELRLTGIAAGATIVEQLVHARRRKGLTVQDVADRAGVARDTVSALEAGRGTISPLIKVLSVLSTDVKPAKPIRSSWAYDKTTDRDTRFTPSDFVADVVDAFGPICIDPCGHGLSPVTADRKIILPDCGLAGHWGPARLAFVNPPFSNLLKWLTRAVDAYEGGEVEKAVILVPTRTDSITFHQRVAPIADIAFLQGRIKFGNPNGPDHPSPYSMMLVVLGGADHEIKRFSELRPATWLRKRGAAEQSV
jgi:transcriptional regulator with XRE-family HTH domain